MTDHQPLTTQQLDEIRDSHPGDWYAGEWRSEYIDYDGDVPAHYVVKHQETGHVLAALPDFAGPIALFVADAHEAVPALLADNQHLRQRVALLLKALARTGDGAQALVELLAAGTDDDEPAAARPAATTQDGGL